MLLYVDDCFVFVEIKLNYFVGLVYMLIGVGGNIGVLVGEDGVLIIDDQFVLLVFKIFVVLGELGSDVLSYVINMYYYGDYIGSNVFFYDYKGVIIFVYDNVCVRFVNDEFVVKGVLLVVMYE